MILSQFFQNSNGGRKLTRRAFIPNPLLIPDRNGARLEAPRREDTRLLPGEEATLVYSQPVTAKLAAARNPTLRVRVFYSAVHPGFKGSRIDPKTDTLRLIREEELPVAIRESAVESRTAQRPAVCPRG